MRQFMTIYLLPSAAICLERIIRRCFIFVFQDGESEQNSLELGTNDAANADSRVTIILRWFRLLGDWLKHRETGDSLAHLTLAPGVHL